VLVVDDNVDAAAMLAELLPLWGHQARVAHGGPEALSLAAEFRPDVVLLDLGLPGMDGYEVARRLRATLGSSPPRLVALTGFGGEDDRRQTHAAGFAHHVTKPVDADELQRLLAAQE
jgi:CheY-like chemotaxis protein